MGLIYTPATYSDGTVRTGAEQTTQETRIDAAFDVVAGAGWTVETLADNAADILAIKGGGGAPVATLVSLLALLTSGTDPGHTHSSGSLTSLPSHPHLGSTDLTDYALLALQTDLTAMKGGLWSSETIYGNAQDILANAAVSVSMQGGFWTSETIYANNQLIITGTSPGHDHAASTDLTDYANLATQANLTAMKGSPWTVETIRDNFLLITTGSAPGHKHPWTDLTGVPSYPSTTDFNALAGAGWNAGLGATGRNAIDLYNNQVAMQGGPWTSETIYDNAQGVADTQGTLWTTETVYQNAQDIITSQTDITDLRGTGYTNRVEPAVLVTGVELIYPSANGSPVAAYDLVFTFVSPGNHTLSWGGGASEVLSGGDITYDLFDPSTTTKIEAAVTIADLSGSSKTDSSLNVFKMNVKNAYDLIDAITGSASVPAHIEYTHGDALTRLPSIITNPANRDLIISNVEGNLSGALVPAGATTGSGTPTLTGGLTATEARIDVITLDSTGTVNVTDGSEFDLASGQVLFPTPPAGELVVRYMFVPGDRAGLYPDDVITEDAVFDFKARWPMIGDAAAFNGTTQDQSYGRSIEHAHLITGMVFSVYRLFNIQQPTDDNPNLTGVDTREKADANAHTAHYNTTPKGRYVLAWNNAAGTLTWDSGTPQIVTGGDATWTLLDSSGVTGIEVDVIVSSLDAGDQSATLEIGDLPIPAVDRYTVFWDESLSELTFDGGTPTSIVANGFHKIPGQNGKWVGVYVEDILVLPAVDVTDEVRVYENNLTDLDNKILQALRFGGGGSGGGGSSTGTASRTWNVGNIETTGAFSVLWGTAPLSKSLTYNHLDVALNASSGDGISPANRVYMAVTTGFVAGRRVQIYDDGFVGVYGRGEFGIIVDVQSTYVELVEDMASTFTVANSAQCIQEETFNDTQLVLPPYGTLLIRRGVVGYPSGVGPVDEFWDTLAMRELRFDGADMLDEPTGTLVTGLAGPSTGVVSTGIVKTSYVFDNWIEWLSNESGLQEHLFVQFVKVPTDCAGFLQGSPANISPALTIRYSTKTDLITDNQISDILLFKQGFNGNDTDDAFASSLTSTGILKSATPGSIDSYEFTQVQFTSPWGGAWVIGGDVVVVVIRAKAKQDISGSPVPSWVRIHDLVLEYLPRPEPTILV